MTAYTLKNIMQEWELSPAQLAKVLCLHTTKLSEYLDDIERIPCALAFSIEAHTLLTDEQQNILYHRRINRKSHSAV